MTQCEANRMQDLQPSRLLLQICPVSPSIDGAPHRYHDLCCWVPSEHYLDFVTPLSVWCRPILHGNYLRKHLCVEWLREELSITVPSVPWSTNEPLMHNAATLGTGLRTLFKNIRLVTFHLHHRDRETDQL